MFSQFIQPQYGNWTPSLGGNGGESGQVYATQEGRYIKIGKLVIAFFTVRLSTLGTITGGLILKGLPFTSANFPTGIFGSSALFWNGTTTSFVVMQINVAVNANTAFIIANTAAAPDIGSQPVQADLNNTTEFRGCLVYESAN